MKRKSIKFTAMCLALAMLLAVPAMAAPLNLNIWSEDSFFARAANFLVLPVHELITLFRLPWKAKDADLDLTGYALVFEDDFEGDTLSSTWWSYSDGRRKGGYWHKNQARVADGNLIIRTEYLEDGAYGPGWYSWRATTKGTFEQAYGYYEVRCILPSAQGMWSAFWLTNANVKTDVPGTQASEIDIMESPLWKTRWQRERGLVTQNIHYGGYELGHRYRNIAVSSADQPYGKYNTYGLLWTPEEYIFYINGKETGRSTFGGVCKEPLYMLLSTEVDGVGGSPSYGWSGKITKNSAEQMPADFVVDYVRVWSK